MKLLDYRLQRGIGRAEAARQLGMDHATVWRHETGRATPRAEQLKKYREWSKGAITARDFPAYAEALGE